MASFDWLIENTVTVLAGNGFNSTINPPSYYSPDKGNERKSVKRDSMVGPGGVVVLVHCSGYALALGWRVVVMMAMRMVMINVGAR